MLMTLHRVTVHSGKLSESMRAQLAVIQALSSSRKLDLESYLSRGFIRMQIILSGQDANTRTFLVYVFFRVLREVLQFSAPPKADDGVHHLPV